jgi:endonuclease III related protein
MKDLLLEIYERLYLAYGPQHWWPAETPFEVMVGAILTQNTAWKNVEKAIGALKSEGILNFDGLRRVRRSRLSSLIRPSGYFRLKAERLKNFIAFLSREFDGDIRCMGLEDTAELRKKLLSVTGIGPETADSILLYGVGKPIFVIDAYTRRILSRHGMIAEKASYDEVQEVFMTSLSHQRELFNEYHALIVHLGKCVCNKSPKCGICPLNNMMHPAWRNRKAD